MAADSNKDLKPLGEEMIVLYEDQQRINLFAKKNTLLNDIKDQISEKEKELQNLEDASTDLMLAEDDTLVPFQVGEVFVNLSVEDVQERLEQTRTDINQEIEDLKRKGDKVEELLKRVKYELYAKFGDNINLEPPDT